MRRGHLFDRGRGIDRVDEQMAFGARPAGDGDFALGMKRPVAAGRRKNDGRRPTHAEQRRRTVDFGNVDETAWPSVELSRDGRWLLVEVSLGWTRVDVHLIDRSTGERRPVVEGTEAVSSFTVVGDRLVGTTTLDAPRGRVVAAPLDSPGPDRWRTGTTPR